MDEGKQFEHVQPRQIGISEPLSGERRVEDDVRSLRGARDRLAATRLAHFTVSVRQPDARMGCVKRGKRQRSGHSATLPLREQKSNAIGR